MTSLVLELQHAALDDQVRVSTLLRKALAVARKLDINDVGDWLQREQQGYANGDEIPKYRHVVGELKARNPFHGLVPVEFEDPEDQKLVNSARIGQAIPEVERLAEGDGRVTIQRGSLPGEFTSLPGYLVLSKPSLHGILSRVRDIVLEWAIHLEKQGIQGEGLSFSAEEREAATHTTTITNFLGPVTNVEGSDLGGATMGDTYKTKIENSNVGAAAVGDGATATGSVTLTETTTISQADYQRGIDNARKALIDDEDQLTAISEGLSEALGQFLRIAREIQVDQMAIKEAQAKMKETLDDVWVEQITPKLKGQALPESLEVVKELLKSPVTAALAMLTGT